MYIHVGELENKPQSNYYYYYYYYYYYKNNFIKLIQIFIYKVLQSIIIIILHTDYNTYTATYLQAIFFIILRIQYD